MNSIKTISTKAERGWRQRTRLIRGGTERSQHGETAEALFLTSGFVYDSAGAAEARFKNEVPGFVYSRYGNPTVAMFEERMALLEGAEAARATASGMAAVHAALMCQLKAGDHVVASRALFGSCRYIIEDILPRFGVTSTPSVSKECPSSANSSVACSSALDGMQPMLRQVPPKVGSFSTTATFMPSCAARIAQT